VLDDDTFSARAEPIEQDLSRTLERVAADYSHHWRGILSEGSQNPIDAWFHNRRVREVIPETRKLVIEFAIDTDKNRLTIQDNAGGMPAEVLRREFTGLDTPGDEKRTGNAAGAYGRGVHVIAQAGEEMFAETLHDGERAGVAVRDARQAPADEHCCIQIPGTRIVVDGVDERLIEKLADRDRVHEYLQARFQPVLANHNAAFRVVIDGKTELVDAVDMTDYDVLWKGDVEFQFEGETHFLTDGVVYEVPASADLPWDGGIAMVKSSAGTSSPVMRIHQYQPKDVQYIDRMVGFICADELCPWAENNAHNGWQRGVLPAGLKSLFQQLEREHFRNGPKRLDERNDLIEQAKEALEAAWDDNPFEEMPAAEGTLGGNHNSGVVGDGGTQVCPTEDVDHPHPDGDPYDANEETADETNDATQNDTEPELTVRCRVRSDDEGGAIGRVYVSHDEGTESGTVKTSLNPHIETEGGVRIPLEPREICIPEGETTGGDPSWRLDSYAPMEGEHVFVVEMHNPLTGDVEEASYSFRIGDEAIVDGAPTGSFLKDIELFPAADDATEFRYDLQRAHDGPGFILLANSAHPEFRAAERRDGPSSLKEQTRTLARWGHEAVVQTLLVQRIETDVEGFTEDGEPLDEELVGVVRQHLGAELSEMVAGLFEEGEITDE
jgi:hypothetical protein